MNEEILKKLLLKHHINVEFERIAISNTVGAAVTTGQHFTEIDHKCIIGVAVQLTDSDALPSSTLKLNIDNQEVFPSGFEASMIYAGQDVSPDERFFTYLSRKVDQTKIDYTWTDGNNSSHTTYTATIYLMCLTSEELDKFEKITGIDVED